jgi:hypothetical protein
VTVVDDDTLRDEPLPSADLIVVRSSVSLGKVRRSHALRNRAPAGTPVFACEGRMFRELGLARRSGETRLRGRSLEFADEAGHAAADGLVGLTEVFDKPPGRVNYADHLGDTGWQLFDAAIEWPTDA